MKIEEFMNLAAASSKFATPNIIYSYIHEVIISLPSKWEIPKTSPIKNVP